MTANEIIERISGLIDRAEITGNVYDFQEARRLLNNDLREAIASEQSEKISDVQMYLEFVEG